MELPAHGRPTSAGDDGRLRRFPDRPPQPHARDADALQRDAALVRRRNELLLELHNEQKRLDMIMRELVETEYAMAERVAPAGQWPMPTMPWSQDRWHHGASAVTTWEDAPLRQPGTCPEHPPCCCRSPAAVRPPPVYPHVERSPSPISMSGYMEYCRSPSKQTLTKEALGPAMANASVRPMGSAIVRQEVKDAVGGERKADLEEGDGVQPLFESRNQSSGQRKAAETTMVDWLNKPGQHSCQHSCRRTQAGQENTAFEQQKRLEFSELAPEQPWLRIGAKQQKCRSPGATVHGMSGYLDLCGEPKVDMENGHGMPPLYKIENHSSGQRKAEESAMEAQIDRPMQSPRGYMPTSLGNTAYSEQKGIDLNEPWPGRDSKQQQECMSSGEHRMIRYLEPSKRTPVDENLVPAIANAIIRPTLSLSLGEEVAPGHGRDIGGEPKVDVEDDHGVRPLYENRNRSNSHRKAVESAIGALIDKPWQPPCQSKPADQENAAYNEQKRIVFSEPTPERTSSALKRRLNAASPLPKKQKPFEESSCTMTPTRQRNLDEYPAGQLHQSNLEALQARITPAELNIEAMPDQWNLEKNWEPVRWENKENVAENRGSEDRPEPAASRWTCRICNANCSSASNFREHLGGRRHRENTEAILAEFRSSYCRMEADSGKSAYYCVVCSVRCTSDAIMASHLIGRKHRQTLQGLE